MKNWTMKRKPLSYCTVNNYLNFLRIEYLATFLNPGTAATASCASATLATSGSTAMGLPNSASGPETTKLAAIRLVMSRSGTRRSNRALDSRFFTPPQPLTA